MFVTALQVLKSSLSAKHVAVVKDQCVLFCFSEVIDEEPIVEVMREEVDEALKLAEEWELKYKVMQ